MKELTKHIEALLVENDCVILPQFGGFVTNHTPARWIEVEQTFLPPYRTIGFNSQLKINDGLLVQSYMLTHDATYPEANRLAEAAIEKLSQELYKEGQVELHGIGTLRRTIVGEYQFDPTENGVITPALYGLGAVEMKTLAMLEEERKQKPAPYVVETKPIETPVIESKDRTITIKIRHEWITNAVAAVAAVMLFFFLSTPVDNTYIEEENYASLGDISVFEQIKKESLLTTLMEAPATTKATPTVAMAPPPIKHSVKAEPSPMAKETPAPVAKAEPTPVAKSTPAPVAKAEPAPQKKSASYNIIIASVLAESDAQHTIDSFASKGHPGAYLIKGNGRFRIALKAFDSEAEAYDKVNELKKDPLFKDAWVLKTRK